MSEGENRYAAGATTAAALRPGCSARALWQGLLQPQPAVLLWVPQRPAAGRKCRCKPGASLLAAYLRLGGSR